MGSGPFKFVSYDAGQSIKGERFASTITKGCPMSGQKPAICCSSSLVAASGDPGKTIPPTVLTTAIFDKAGARPAVDREGSARGVPDIVERVFSCG